MMWNRFGGGGWGCYGGRGDFFGIILFIGFLVVLAVLFMFGAARMRRHGHCLMTSGHDALYIARERYAKGEISEEEYKKIKENL